MCDPSAFDWTDAPRIGRDVRDACFLIDGERRVGGEVDGGEGDRDVGLDQLIGAVDRRFRGQIGAARHEFDRRPVDPPVALIWSTATSPPMRNSGNANGPASMLTNPKRMVFLLAARRRRSRLVRSARRRLVGDWDAVVAAGRRRRVIGTARGTEQRERRDDDPDLSVRSRRSSWAPGCVDHVVVSPS